MAKKKILNRYRLQEAGVYLSLVESADVEEMTGRPWAQEKGLSHVFILRIDKKATFYRQRYDALKATPDVQWEQYMLAPEETETTGALKVFLTPSEACVKALGIQQGYKLPICKPGDIKNIVSALRTYTKEAPQPEALPAHSAQHDGAAASGAAKVSQSPQSSSRRR